MQKNISLLLLCIAMGLIANAQVRDTISIGKRLDIITAKRYNFQKSDSGNQFVSLAGNVEVRQEKTLFYADSAVLNQKLNILEAFGNVHINDADSVHTYAQYLKYLGKEKIAYLKNNVKLTDGKGVLTTDELEYNTATKIGIYTKGGKIVDGKTVLTSKEAYYNGQTRDVYFKKKVVLNDPEYHITTDSLLYNTYTNIATFICPTKILTGSRKINTREGYYDLKNRKAQFGSNTIIEDSTYSIVSHEMHFDDSTGKAVFYGNVFYQGKDTANDFDLHSDTLQTNNKNGSVLATSNPVLVIKRNGDSTFIKADTLYSAKLSQLLKTRTVPIIRDSSTEIKIEAKDSAVDKFFEAYHNVRIFSDSMQAVGDSLFYTLKDSVFRLFQHPVAWAQENQITGDTIYLYVQNNKPQRIRVFENAMAISLSGLNYYNQVGGKSMTGYFVDGKINYLHTKGSPAQSVYYEAADDGKFIGVNSATSDVIDMYFKEGRPFKVVFRNKLEGTSYPMGQVDHVGLRLRGFKWQNDRRPKSKFEFIEGKSIKADTKKDLQMILDKKSN
jgi:lipopolysaccharide export system protein LptA